MTLIRPISKNGSAPSVESLTPDSNNAHFSGKSPRTPHATVNRNNHRRDARGNHLPRGRWAWYALPKPYEQGGAEQEIIRYLRENELPLSAARFIRDNAVCDNALEQIPHVIKEQYDSLRRYNKNAKRHNRKLDKKLQQLGEAEAAALELLLEQRTNAERKLGRAHRRAAQTVGGVGISYVPASPVASLEALTQVRDLDRNAASESALATGEEKRAQLVPPAVPDDFTPAKLLSLPSALAVNSVVAILGTVYGLSMGALQQAFVLTKVYKLAEFDTYWFGLLLWVAAGIAIALSAKTAAQILMALAADAYFTKRKFVALLLVAGSFLGLIACIDMATLSVAILATLTLKNGSVSDEMRQLIHLSSLFISLPYLGFCAGHGWITAREKLLLPRTRRDSETEKIYQLTQGAATAAAQAAAKKAQAHSLTSSLISPLCPQIAVVVNTVLVREQAVSTIETRIKAMQTTFAEKRAQLEATRISLRDDLNEYDLHLIEDTHSTAERAKIDHDRAIDKLVLLHEKPRRWLPRLLWNLGLCWDIRLPRSRYYR